jgi:hypothetical protein
MFLDSRRSHPRSIQRACGASKNFHQIWPKIDVSSPPGRQKPTKPHIPCWLFCLFGLHLSFAQQRKIEIEAKMEHLNPSA